MNLPERKWFRFEELADRWKRWKIHTDLIYRYVEGGQLKSVFKDRDRNGELILVNKKPGGLGHYEEVITLEEVQRFESEHMGAVQSTGIPPYLDPDNPHYASELAAAVHAWMHIYKQGTLPPQRVPTKTIRTWLNVHLKEYVAEPSNGMIDRVSTIVNSDANKLGGAHST